MVAVLALRVEVSNAAGRLARSTKLPCYADFLAVRGSAVRAEHRAAAIERHVIRPGSLARVGAAPDPRHAPNMRVANRHDPAWAVSC